MGCQMNSLKTKVSNVESENSAIKKEKSSLQENNTRLEAKLECKTLKNIYIVFPI